MAVSSLSADAKDGVARDVPDAGHCREALLTGLALYGRHPDRFTTQRNAVARLLRTLLLAHGAQAHIEKLPQKRLRGAPVYCVPLPPALRASAAWKPVHRCDRVMEARAAFLACGSLSAGARGYHLEFVLPHAVPAERLAWTLRAVADPPKLARRNGREVLYYKDFDAIAGFLAVIGAHPAVLRLEDLRALKETKNRIHRLVNTEASNLERAAAAAASQRQAIEAVRGAGEFGRLTPALREIAALRLAHPDESLAELGRRCTPPISKPAVNGRLSAIARLARTLRGESARGSRKV